MSIAQLLRRKVRRCWLCGGTAPLTSATITACGWECEGCTKALERESTPDQRAAYQKFHDRAHAVVGVAS